MTRPGRIQWSLRSVRVLAGVLPLGCGGLVESGPEATDLAAAGGAFALPAGTGGKPPLSPASGGSTAHQSGGTGGTEPNAGFLAAEPAEFCGGVCEANSRPCVQAIACAPAGCLEQAGDWGPLERAAFEQCVRSEDLCARSIEACMLDLLFPPLTTPRSHHLLLEHLGLDTLHDVYAGVLYPDGESRLSAMVATDDEQVAFSWEAPWAGDVGGTFYAWIDLDRDGRCESGDDVFGYGVAVWNGSFKSPIYEAYIGAYFYLGDAACPILGYGDPGLPVP